ncbi:DUF4350 domain-containing protein [Angustibacter aerolatus]
MTGATGATAVQPSTRPDAPHRGPAAAGVESGPVDASGASRRRRGWRWPAAAVTAVVLAAVAGLVLLRPTSSGALDPEDATPQGTRALAHVLRDHGVPVQVRRTFADVERDLGTDGAATTLVVSRPDLLNPTRGADLAALLRTSGADVVLVSPGETLLSDLGLPVARRDPVEDRLRDPGCDDPVARRAGRALLGGDAYVTARGSSSGTDTADPTSAATVVGCYADGDDAAPLLLVTSADGRRSTVLGSGDALSNGQLATAGDAALAIGLVATGSRVVWWVPNALDGSTVDQPPTLTQLLPDGVRFGAAQLVVVLLVVVLWRARRLGRLTTEPLPVVVRAIETTRGRAQLYRRARARGRADQVLRAAAVRRLAVRCGLARAAEPEEVAAVVATRTGRPARDVTNLLVGTDPDDDVALVLLARELDALETEVRRP